MSNELVPVNGETWQVIQSVAPVVQASRMFGVTEEQAAVVMLKGHELQLGLASAFEFIHVIDSKPSISPKGALALIQKSDHLMGLSIKDEVDSKGEPSACTVTMRRVGGFEYTCTYTMADAQRAGVIKAGSAWEKYPANMLRWRAVGYCADVVFPDVIGGLYRPEELGATVNADGEPLKEVEAAPAVQVIDVTPTEVPQVAAQLTIADIIAAGFTAEQIVAANEGTIPSTSEECSAVLEALQVAA